MNMDKTENIESYEILLWLIEKAVPGLYLLCASPKMQEEIISHCKEGNIAVCDYREREKHFRVEEIETWMKENPQAGVYVLLNFQYALWTQNDIWALNLARDRLARSGKALLFCVTELKEQELRKTAIDFCSCIMNTLYFEDELPDEESGKLPDFHMSGREKANAARNTSGIP